MINASVKGEPSSQFDFDDVSVHLQVAGNCASLHLRAARLAPGSHAVPEGVLEAPVDPGLGQDDPRLRVLRAMQAAAAAEIERLRKGGAAKGVHVPQSLDLSDLRRFPSAAMR